VWQGFTIALREGLESFLIVALTLAYLRKTGRSRLAKAVVLGAAVSVLVSVGAGLLLGRAANQPLWEGVLAGVSVLLVSSLLVYMLKAAGTMKSDLERRIDRAAAGFGGVFLFTVLMITREGMETALMLFQLRKAHLIFGCVLGVLAAAAMAYLWGRYGHRIDLHRFFQVTGIFLLLFVLQIGLYTFHEFSEAGILPQSEALHAATEPYSPDGMYGKWFSLGMVAVCAGWLAWAAVVDRRKRAVEEAGASVRS